MNPRILGIIGGLALIVALLSPFMMGSSKKVEQLYYSAKGLSDQGDYEGAIAKYEEALEEATKRGVKTEVIDKDFTTLANLQIAIAYSRIAEKTGDDTNYDKALQHIEEVSPNATIAKHQEGLTFLWGHILYRTDQYELAEAKFMQLIENFPNSLQVENAWYAIGQLNYKLGNYEDSRTAFSNILVGFPNSEFKDDAQLHIAQSFLNESNYEQAYPEFDKFATEEFKNHPELHAEAMYKAGLCLKLLNRHDEAISRYTNFITQFPEDQLVTAAYFDQGSIYAAQKDYDNARVNYELALQNTADRGVQSEIQSAIGQTYFDQADYENAILSYTKLLEEYPESTYVDEAKLGIADSQFQLESWNEAASSYQLVIEHEKNAMQADAAELNYTPYCSFQVGEAYYKLGTNQRDAGQMQEGTATLELALEWYQKTVDDFPENPVVPHAIYGAIWTLNDLDRKEDLEKVAQEFIEKNRNDNEYDILAAEVQLSFANMKRTEFKQYVEAAEEYAKLWDYRPLPKFHLIKLMGKFFEGRSYYEAAKPEGYQEGDASADFNMEYLQKSVKAYEAAVNEFSDAAFKPGIEEGRYQDFPDRISQVEACLMNEALSHEMLGAWDVARQRYAMIPETSDFYERSLLLTADSYVKQGEKSQAITYYDSILPKLTDKNNLSLAEIKLADLLRAEERFEEAAVQYQAVVESNPTGEYADDALYLIGLCYYNASSEKPELAEKSEAAFNRVIAEYGDTPNAIDAYFGLVLLYQDAAQKRGDTAKWSLIVQTADAASEKFANSSEEVVLQTLGRIDLIKAVALENTNADDVDSLVASLQRVIDNPGALEDARMRSQLKIGHAYYGKERYQEALAAYNSFVEKFPNSEIAPSAQYQAAVCYYQIAQQADDAEAAQLAYTNAASAAEKVAEMTDNVDNRISAGYTLGLAKLGLKDTKAAIEAFMQVTALEGQTEDEARKNLISQAHSRLAELHSSVGNYAAAVKEYQYIIANTEEDDLRGRSYFAMAYAQDEHLKVYDDALASYQNAIGLADDVVKAQSYYRMGLIYQDKLNEFDKALEVFQNLIANHSNEQNTGVASMVADANLRRSELYVKLGRLDEAIAEAVTSVDDLKASSTATVSQKVAAQYNLGFLYSDKARTLYPEELPPGFDLKPYFDTSGLAAAAFFEVSKLASPVEKANKQTVIPYVQNSLFQSGQIYYSLGVGNRRRAELLLTIDPLTEFIKYADAGVFPASDDLSANVETALTYLASANFDLGRMQVGLDEEMSPQAVAYFESSVKVFNDLVKRYPNAADAALWQYQAGEAYYTTEQFKKAIAEYDKVRRVNKSHEKAPESLYAIATCYQYLSEAAKDAGNADAEKAFLDKLFETNETLVKEYKDSKFAGEAFINIGNKHYNAALDTDLEATEQIRLFRLAIENYERALAAPGLSAESKNTAQGFLNETASFLAHNEYKYAISSLGRAQRASKKSDIEAAIELFRAITKAYSTTKYGDLSYGKLGEAYTILANKEENYYAQALYYFQVLPKKYAVINPPDPQVQDAINYCILKANEIKAYMQANNIQPLQQAPEEGN
ncbi:tetratricopeptide repeat protein [Candidatus Poribacteria bacterium]|nr:tetratricopeptide repeat protein [Candidatus Poribacteria bacterium]